MASSTYYKAPKIHAGSAAAFQYTRNNDWIMELWWSDTDYGGGVGDPRSYTWFPRKPGWIFIFRAILRTKPKNHYVAWRCWDSSSFLGNIFFFGFCPNIKFFWFCTKQIFMLGQNQKNLYVVQE